MSEVRLKDGTGKDYVAKVTNENKLATKAVTESELHHAIDLGNGWNMESGYLTLTSANASGVLYLKNTSTKIMHVDLYVILTKASTGGAGGEVLVEVLRNPTGGTVISDASDANPVNMNFSSSKTPSGVYYKGGEGKTFTGHDNAFVSKTTDDTRLLLGVLTVLPQGSALGVRLTPPTGNTSMEVNTIVELYETPEAT